MQAPTIAAHHFGFSEPDLRSLRSDPRGWVREQFRRPAALDEAGLLSGAEAGALTRSVMQSVLKGAGAAQSALPASAAALMNDTTQDAPRDAPRDPDRKRLRQANLAGLQRRWQHIVSTPTPVFERWVLFWSNHFCVAATKGATLGLVWPHEREAIRPHLTGRFADLVRASTLHPGMLLYLDNAQSMGPDSRAGRRRQRGLNENLARELLELHTVGVHGGYTQADVTEVAKLLTGWTVSVSGDGGGMQTVFTPSWHQPGDKRVLGKTYREGPEAVDQLIMDLVRQPGTAQHVAGKLVRHFVSDDPPAALVDAVVRRFKATDGDLMAVADALFGSDLAWRDDVVLKFKRPEELMLSAHRMLALPLADAPAQMNRLVVSMTDMGQAPGRAPSPQGWPDRSEDWLASDALWKRIQWASAFAAQRGGQADARQLAADSLGSDLSSHTRDEIERADSGGQALALLFSSPDFQRR